MSTRYRNGEIRHQPAFSVGVAGGHREALVPSNNRAASLASAISVAARGIQAPVLLARGQSVQIALATITQGRLLARSIRAAPRNLGQTVRPRF